MHFEIVQRPAIRVGAVRHVGPYDQITHAFERLGAIAGSAGLLSDQVAAMMAIYQDDPESTLPDQLRSYACLVVPEEQALPDGLEERRVPEGRYARTVHIGPYEALGDTWARFRGERLPESGHRARDAESYEIYLNTPMDTPKEDLRTEIYVPIV